MSKSRGPKGIKKTPSDTFDHSNREVDLEVETPQGELSHGQTTFIGPANLKGDLTLAWTSLNLKEKSIKFK